MIRPAAPNASSTIAPTRARFTLSAWLAGSAAIAYLCRQSLVVAESTIRADLKLSEEQMGLIISLFFWCYALAQIPGGWLGDRFGARRCLPAFAAVWSFATAAFGWANGATLFLVGRSAAGFAQAGLFPCSAEAISRWHSLTERALASGFLAAAMQVGAIVAAPLTGVLLDVISWRMVFVLYAIPGVLWAGGFYWWFRERIEDHPSANDAEVQLVRQGRQDTHNSSGNNRPSVPWLRMFCNGTLWLICAQQFFRAAAYVWFASWFATYLQETRDVSREASGWLTAIPLVASLVASLTSGSLSDWVLRRTGSYGLARNGVSVVSLLICSVLVGQAYFIADARWATVSISAGAFFAACAGPCAYAATIDLGGQHVASVFGTMNMAGNLGAALLAMAVPYYRQFIENNSELLQLFDGNSWNAVLVLFVAMYVLAAACWLPLRVDGRAIGETTSEEAPND